MGSGNPLKISLYLNTKGQKAACHEKAPQIKRKNAYSKLRGLVAEGRGDVDVDVDD
jgi:hypothetical protein